MSEERSVVGVLTTDAQLLIRTWNGWLAAATGRSEEEVRGRSLTDITDGPTASWAREIFTEVLEGGTPRVLAPAFHRYMIPCPPRVPSPHFERMQQRVTVAPLRDATAIVGLIVTIEDVTDRLHEERVLALQLQQQGEAQQAALQAVGAEDWRLRRSAVQTLRRSASREDIAALIDSLQRDHHDLNLLSSALQVLIAADIEVVEPLTALLDDADPNLRMHAALALGALGATAAVPRLVGALADADTNVRFHAIEALGAIGAPESVEPLAAIAATGDFFLAFPAIDALARTDDPRIGARLTGLLEREELRPAVIDLLASLGDEDSVAPLVERLNDGSGDPVAIAGALHRIHARYEESYAAGAQIADAARGLITPAGIALLAGALERRIPPLKPLVAVLGWVGAPAAAVLASALGEIEVQASLDEALMRVGRDAVDVLLPRLQDGSRQERLAAAALLGRLGDRRAVAPLRPLLDGVDVDLTCTVGAALAALGDASALESLLPLLGHAVASVRQAAIAAINSIGADSTAERVSALLRDADPRVRESAIRIAGYFGFENTVNGVFAAAEDDHPDVRRAAIEQLPVLDHPDATARLVAALAHEVPRNRAAAAHALRSVDDADTIWPLQAALADVDPWVRYFAAGSLGQKRSVEAVPALLRVAGADPAPHVRIAAIHALGAIGAPDLIAVAAGLTREPDDDLAAAALTALGGITDPRVDDMLEAAATGARLACRVPAAQALARRGTPRAVEILSVAARLDDPVGLRAVAIESLRRIAAGDGEAAAAATSRLIELAGDVAQRDELLAIVSTLPSEAIDVVASELASESVSVRTAAAAALGHLRHPRASEQLRRALDDPSPAVRDTAVAAFGRLATSSIAARLAEMAETDPDAGVRRRAEAVCRRHGWIERRPRP